MHNDGLLKVGDEEVELGSGLTWDMVGEAMGADEVLQPREVVEMCEN